MSVSNIQLFVLSALYMYCRYKQLLPGVLEVTIRVDQIVHDFSFVTKMEPLKKVAELNNNAHKNTGQDSSCELDGTIF